MATVTRSSGITVTTPDAVEVAPGTPPGAGAPPSQRGDRSPGRPRGPIPLPTRGESTAESAAILAALSDELTLADVIPLRPTVTPTTERGTRSRRAEPVDPQQRVDVEVPLQDGEWAVLLVEQDGVYAWDFGEVGDAPAAPRAPGAGARRSATRSADRVARFHLDLHARGTPARRRSTEGFVRGLLLRPAIAAIFTFAAGFVVGQLVKRLERDVERGLLQLTAADLETWTRVPDAAQLDLPTDRPARILLFVHGTFSSTVAAYGELALTEAGRAFLEDAHDAYDAVLGFDHASLSEDPVENAEQLLSLLQALPGAHPPIVDVIAHSRGALVIRSLVEHLLPALDERHALVRRLVLVGGPNNGTALAQTSNWHALIDLYTNLAVAGSRALALLGPKGAAAGAILRAVLNGLARFVKAVAVAGVDAARVPGVAAMDPTQAFVRELNGRQHGQPTRDDLDVYVITSDFDSTAEPDPSTGMAPRFVQALADRLVDQLMGVENDLVVNVDSMSYVDGKVGDADALVRGVHDFGTTAHVHHMNYFVQPATFDALRRWLELRPPGTSSGQGILQGEPGRVVADLASVADADFTVIDAAMPATEALTIARMMASRYVVVRRFEPGDGAIYHYAFTLEEFLDVTQHVGPNDPARVNELGILFESQASDEVGPARVHGYSVATEGAPWARRQVVVADGRPIGVVPHASEVEPPALALPETAPPPTDPGVRGPDDGAPHPVPRRRSSVPRRRSAGAPSATRGEGTRLPAAPTTGASERAGAETVRQHFRAQMDDEVEVDRGTTLMVEISAEELAASGRGGEATGSGDAIASRKISIAVIGRRNVRVVGDDRIDVEPAQPNAPHRLFFEVRGTHLGDGEVWVIAQQGPQPLATLELRVAVVAQRSAGLHRLAVGDAIAPMPARPNPRNQLRIVEQRHGTRTSFDFEFRSEALDHFEFATTHLDREPGAYVASLYDEIEQRWVRNRSDADAFTLDLQAMGAELFEQLIPERIQRALWEGRDTIDSIEVVSTEPFIPWELVHLRDPDARGLDGTERFFGLMGMVRWLHGAGIAPPTIKLAGAAVKAVVPSYPAGSGKELPATETELAFLENALGAERVPAQHADLLGLLRTPGSFDVLHFAGHGVATADDIANAQLLLEGHVEDGMWYPSELSATTVAAFANLATADGARPLVFLNACQVGRTGHKLSGLGGFAQAFLTGRAGAFVGSLWAVGDEPAATFTTAFYEALKAGKTLAEATTAARQASRAAGEATWLAYAVYGDPHAVAT